MTTKHPCAGLTKAQITAFEIIAINENPNCSEKTLNVLLNAGLIIKLGDRLLAKDRFGDITVPVYEVPIHHHMQWCEWCSENLADV